MTASQPSLVVLVSGSGTNLQAILDACKTGAIPARVAAVISNKAEAYALERARHAGVEAVYLPKLNDEERTVYDERLAEVVSAYRPAWVVLAGWMRILSNAFIHHFPNRIINLHPALPGCFPGTHAIERAYEAYQRGEVNHTGVMVHLVPDEGVDSGPVLAQSVVLIYAEDTLEELEERIHRVEHQILTETLSRMLTDPQAFRELI